MKLEQLEDGSEGLLEWNKEKAKKGCEATVAEAGEDIQDAKEAMELMANGTSIDGIDVCRPAHEVSKNTDLQDLSGERTMAKMSKAVLQAADKGKMTVLLLEIITLQDIRPTHTRKTIELRFCCKWIAKNVTTKERPNFCCMLLDRGTIQVGCTDTKKWRRTLDNKTTLIFGRYTRIEPIANDSFPEHYFNFVAYNEVQSKADVKVATLTEMPKPVVIAVSSTWVTTRYEGLQLTATSATHYYLNPNIPEVHHILSVYANFIYPTDALDIKRQPANTDEEEQ
ncbi:DNA helicase [Tanacetum coccineum]